MIVDVDQTQSENLRRRTNNFSATRNLPLLWLLSEREQATDVANYQATTALSAYLMRPADPQALVATANYLLSRGRHHEDDRALLSERVQVVEASVRSKNARLAQLAIEVHALERLLAAPMADVTASLHGSASLSQASAEVFADFVQRMGRRALCRIATARLDGGDVS